MRNILITILVLIIVGSLGAGYFIMKQRQVEEQDMNRFTLAEGKLDSKDYQGAVDHLLPLAEKGKGFKEPAKVLYMLAKAYEGLGAAEAQAIWKRLVEKFPESEYHDEGKLKLALAMRDEKPEEARTMFEKIASNKDSEYRGEALLAIAESYLENDREKARELFYQILETDSDDEVIAQAKDHLSKINHELLWSPILGDFCELYTVQPGDSNVGIGQKFKTTGWYIGEANDIKPNQLKPGKRLKVLKEPFKIVVDKSTCHLNLLTESGKFVKWYPVCIGEEDYMTPAGEYKIATKQIEPKWYKPKGGVVPPMDPENALGSRWMGIYTADGRKTSLGIHGTNEPDTVGSRQSAGCVRMLNKDVEELYKLVTYGIKVSIVNDMESSNS